jgi:hypothetical protein
MDSFSKCRILWTCSIFPALLAAVFAIGCDNSSAPATKPTGTNADAVPQIAKPGKDQKNCFQCGGQGTVVCRGPGCAGGKAECPNPCLKLTRGSWIRMNVAGHSPNELWQKFPNTSGKGGYQAWNQAHVGEVITYQNGVAVNIGACKVCGGTTKVECRVCKGQAKTTCEICKGEKFVPNSWTATDNPWLNSQPDLIRLKDGQVLFGKVVATNKEDLTIMTRDKKIKHVNVAEILPKSSTNSAAAAGGR